MGQRGLGTIPVEDFKTGIRALNSSITSAQGRSAPLSDAQIEVLAQHVDRDGDGQVDYNEFVSAFRRVLCSSALLISARCSNLLSAACVWCSAVAACRCPASHADLIADCALQASRRTFCPA